RMQAGIAVAAMLRRLLAKIMQNGLAPAAGDLTKAEHGIELLAFHALVQLVAGGAGQHLAQLDHILQAVGHPGGGGLTIAPGPAGRPARSRGGGPVVGTPRARDSSVPSTGPLVGDTWAPADRRPLPSGPVRFLDVW